MTDEELGLDAAFEEEATGEEIKEEVEEKTEPEVEDTGTPPEPPKLVPIAALQDERQKAQRLKKEIDELKAKIPKADSAPDPIDDPEGYKAYVRDEVEREHTAKQTKEFNDRVEASRAKMLESHDDYTAMEEDFYILASKDQSLQDEMYLNPEPAKFAYEKAQAYRTEQKELLRAEILSEIEVDPEPSESEKRNKSAIKAPSLAKATSQGNNSVPREEEEGLEDVFKDQAY